MLVLDEPTNDLDIDTLELLEELLQDYAGTVFLVSHDRRFLDNVVTSTIAWEGDESPGLWREYEGGYEDWKLQRDARARAARSRRAKPRRAGAEAAPPPQRRRAAGQAAQAQLQGAARARRAAGAHRGAGGRAEGARRACLGQARARTRSEPQRVADAQARYAQIDDELMAALERWEALARRGLTGRALPARLARTSVVAHRRPGASG